MSRGAEHTPTTTYVEIRCSLGFVEPHARIIERTTIAIELTWVRDKGFVGARVGDMPMQKNPKPMPKIHLWIRLFDFGFGFWILGLWAFKLPGPLGFTI